MGTTVLDNVESLNIPKFIPSNSHEPFPDFLHPFRPEIESFSRRSLKIASKIFTLFSLILELPETYFSDQHRYDDASEDHLRYMIYHPRPVADDAKVQNTWSRAHTDFGSLTLPLESRCCRSPTQNSGWRVEVRSTCSQRHHM